MRSRNQEVVRLPQRKDLSHTFGVGGQLLRKHPRNSRENLFVFTRRFHHPTAAPSVPYRSTLASYSCAAALRVFIHVDYIIPRRKGVKPPDGEQSPSIHHE